MLVFRMLCRITVFRRAQNWVSDSDGRGGSQTSNYTAWWQKTLSLPESNAQRDKSKTSQLLPTTSFILCKRYTRKKRQQYDTAIKTKWLHTDETLDKMASSSLLKSVLAWTADMMSGWSCWIACTARLQWVKQEVSTSHNSGTFHPIWLTTIYSVFDRVTADIHTYDSNS